MPLLLVLAAWSYWPVITDLVRIWQRNEDYSAGGLVPLIVPFLLWRERKAIGCRPVTPFQAGGAALLVLAEVGRTCGFLSLRPAVEHYALVATVAGLVLLVLGRHVFRRVFWILLFLVLMVPLPGIVHSTVSGPLQQVATAGSVFLLETCRVPVMREGNIIVVDGDASLEVAQACSGLRMLMAFLIVAAFIAYMVKRPRWQKGVLFLSSVPVAVVCNVIRIFVTALLVRHVSEDVAQKFFHDFAGLLMMPIAVLLLFGEIRLMDEIVVSPPETPPSGPTHGGPQIIVSKHARGKGLPQQAQRVMTVAPRCAEGHAGKMAPRSRSPSVLPSRKSSPSKGLRMGPPREHGK